MKIIGLDAGSVSTKLVVLDAAGNVLQSDYKKHWGHPVEVALEMLKAAGADEDCTIAVTGSANKLIAQVLGIEAVNEIVAQACATRRLHPDIRTIIEMGGQDSKLIILDDEGMKDFAMNWVCAAGTGSFLDQQAERLRLSIEEFSELSLRSKRPPRIAGRCSVFAKSDMIHLQQIATPMEDIVAGLCFALARNFKGSIVRGRKIAAPVSFQGGVAANKGMVRAFREVFEIDELFVPPDFAVMGAMGAAIMSREEGIGSAFRLKAIEEYLWNTRDSAKGHPPLLQDGDAFYERHVKDSKDVVHDWSLIAPKASVYMGIDIGSISTNVAVIDSNGKLLYKSYLMTAGKPIEAVRQGLRETAEEIDDRVTIAGVGTTGSGRYMISDYVGADIVKNEITAQATGAVFIDPMVDTIFEIGGQDSKYISLENGVIVDFEMNKACAAGTGSFLDEQAEKLNVSVKNEFAECAFASHCPSKLGERCTVFMGNSITVNLQRGMSRDDLLAGLSYSIVQNYINRVVAGKRIGKNIFFQGGVAFNKSVVAAFEKHLGQTITVPPNHDVTGAIGMALIAMRHMLARGATTSTFRGFERVQRPYEISSFGCNGCSNQCEINRVKVEGEKQLLFYGGRCEKYDINRKDTSHIPDLFKFRDEALWNTVKEQGEPQSQRNGDGPRAKLGIPFIFYFNEYLPYWVTLLRGLGFDLEVSPQPNRQIVDLGLEGVLSEACFPVKVAIGHIRYLKEKGADAIFLPSFVNLNLKNDEYAIGAACPHIQSIPYVGSVAVPGIEILAPVVDLGSDREKLVAELRRSLKRFRIVRRDIRKVIDDAEHAQAAFAETIRKKGEEVLAGLTEKAIVIVGRPYNALERGMNLRIPEKLATLGVMAIPLDMLPLDDHRIAEDWPNMYWRSGQQILRAARFIAAHDKLYPIVIGNFSCGPDSFILKYFKEELRGKPFLHIEIDEHSADAGAITRCEAYVDSIGHRSALPSLADRSHKKRKAPVSLKGRVMYLPPMSDHVHAMASAFEHCGMDAVVLPESDKETVEVGMRYASGKECYPCIVTTGDMMKKALSKDFEPSRAAFFMPSGLGPCRFGQYNVFHKMVLESAGLSNVPVFAPNQDGGLYEYLATIRGDLALNVWKGIVAFDVLLKCLHETRPYEMHKGMSDTLYRDSSQRICKTLKENGANLDKVLTEIRKEFEILPKQHERRPLIGLIGEIYVRMNRFANENIIRKVEALGGEVWLTTASEWILYINAMSIRSSLKNGKYMAAAKDMLKRYIQIVIERCYGGSFNGYLRTLHEPSTKQLLRFAAPYIPDTFEGEAVLSIGKSVDLEHRGASGIINAIPFGCMPGTIVTAVSRAVAKVIDLPIMHFAYDGTESTTMEIQLEAFMDQARNKH